MIARNTRVLSISLSPEIAREVERLARSEKKSKSELIRDSLKVYKLLKFERNWANIRKLGEKTRKKYNLKTEDALLDYIHGN